PAGGQTAHLVGVNATNGSTVWTSEPGFFTGWPAPCVDEATAVCGTDAASQNTQVVRVAAANGRPLASPAISTNPSGRDLGPGLFDPGTRNPDLLVAVSGGEVAWRQPLAKVFNQRGLSSDNGWNFDRVPASGLFVGSVSGAPVTRTKTTAVIDLASNMTAGFRIATGATVWRAPGTEYSCNELPCTGSTAPSGTGASPI